MKKEILQTSLEQFLKYGIRKVSVQKLVEPLGISTKTVYKHFKNKENLLREALLFYYEQKYHLLDNGAKEQNAVALFCNIWYGAIEAELKVNQVFFRDLLHYYPELNERFAATTDKVFTELFMRILQQGINEELLREDIIPQVALDGMYVLYAAIVRQEHLKKIRITSLDLLTNTMLIYVRGLCTHKGKKEFNAHVQTFRPVANTRKPNGKVAVNRISLN
ncbi:MAG: TetR/AcrR family transcriptional regulator [Ferruginibacter sp.]